MSKKIIGIPGWVINDAFGVRLPYIQYASQFGTVLILTPEMKEVQKIDLLFLPGGADVDPFRYNESPGYMTGNPNVFLEYFDKEMLPKYIDAGIPIIACCRGLQTVVTHFGGKLTQHLIDHEQSAYPSHTCHDLFFVKEKGLKDLIPYGTNSRHHQCADPNTIPSELEVIAYAATKIKHDIIPDMSIPEIIVHRTLPIFLFQGHLEDLPTQMLGAYFFEKFLNKA